jgi:hypothetical protein
MTTATSSVNYLTIDNVSNSVKSGTDQIETDMNALIDEISTSSSPSQAQLMQLQTYTIKWQAMVSAQTGVLKALGDTMRTVVNNIGG